MLKVDIHEKVQLDGKKVLFSLLPWIDIETGNINRLNKMVFDISEYEEKINGKALVLSCNEGEYLHIPHVLCGKTAIQITGYSWDNEPVEGYPIFSNKPRELYISLFDSTLTHFEKSNEKYKRYLVYVLNDQDYSVEKYQIVVRMILKNSSMHEKQNFVIDYMLDVHKINSNNLFFQTTKWAAFISFGLIIYKAIIRDLDLDLVLFAEAITILTFLGQYIYLYLYDKTTLANKIVKAVKNRWRKLLKKDTGYYYSREITTNSVKKLMRSEYKKSNRKTV